MAVSDAPLRRPRATPLFRLTRPAASADIFRRPWLSRGPAPRAPFAPLAPEATRTADIMIIDDANPCRRCGACCAFFRASFYYAEADDVTPGGVPTDLTRDLTQFRRVMLGTHKFPPRCIALRGPIGDAHGCGIYARRPAVCREFPPSFHDGRTPNPDCDRARAAHGLTPLAPSDWPPTRGDDRDDDPRPLPDAA